MGFLKSKEVGVPTAGRKYFLAPTEPDATGGRASVAWRPARVLVPFRPCQPTWRVCDCHQKWGTEQYGTAPRQTQGPAYWESDGTSEGALASAKQTSRRHRRRICGY